LPGRRHHHKLKKLLQAAGVPPWERRRLPLIFVGAELAAVADRWVCAPFAARDGEPGVQIVLERVKNRV
jgi:tRNA(Ile)-lysidine synthase